MIITLEGNGIFSKDYVGRPSPLYFSERLTKHFGGAKIYLKRDELNHTGAHKINNVLGQILLAKRMGKKGLLLKLELVNMELRQQQSVPLWFKNVLFLWVKQMWKDKPQMFLE